MRRTAFFWRFRCDVRRARRCQTTTGGITGVVQDAGGGVLRASR